MHSPNIYNKEPESGYLSVFFFSSGRPLLWRYVLPDLVCADIHILWKSKAGKEKKISYFGTSGYSQEDIAAAVLFTGNLSRGNIHILLSSKPLF